MKGMDENAEFTLPRTLGLRVRRLYNWLRQSDPDCVTGPFLSTVPTDRALEQLLRLQAGVIKA